MKRFAPLAFWFTILMSCAASAASSLATISLNHLDPTVQPLSAQDLSADNAVDRFKLFLSRTKIDIGSAPDYLIINVVGWSKGKVNSSVWAIYNKALNSAIPWHKHAESISTGNRMYGWDNFGILVVNTGLPNCDELTYTVSAQHVTPQNVQDLKDLFSYVLSKVPAGVAAEEVTTNCYGYAVIGHGLPSLPVDITVAAQGMDAASTISVVMHDEGYHVLDASVGMPLASYKNITFNSENSIVVPKSTDKITPYAFGDIYPFGGGDLSATGFAIQPKLSVGLPIGSRPLNYPFFGAGVNVAIKKFRFSPFIGALHKKVDRTRTLSPGSVGTMAALDQDRYTKRVTTLMYGLSFSVTDAVKLFKSDSSKQASAQAKSGS